MRSYVPAGGSGRRSWASRRSHQAAPATSNVTTRATTDPRRLRIVSPGTRAANGTRLSRGSSQSRRRTGSGPPKWAGSGDFGGGDELVDEVLEARGRRVVRGSSGDRLDHALVEGAGHLDVEPGEG